MPLTKPQKEKILKALVEEMKSAKSIVFADFQGLTMKDLDNLRKQMGSVGVKYQVAKKTLISKAAKELGYGDLPKEVIQGPVGVVMSMKDEIIGAKLIHQFAKKNDKLKLRGGLMEGKILSIADAKMLATMPSKEELLGKFVYLVRYPVQGFHGVLYQTMAGFVRALDAVAKKA